MEEDIRAQLAETPYAPSALKPLTGGTANFIYRATLVQPLADGTSDVVVKHGEAYVATVPDFKLNTSRCEVEEECLRVLAGLPPSATAACVVGTPRLYSFNPATNTQVQEYLPNATSLKEYALKHYEAPTPSSLEPECLDLGDALGKWLRSFHDWGNQPTQAQLRELLAGNRELQSLKHMINYQALIQKASQHPSILQDVRDVLLQISETTAAELLDDGKLEVIHGDFWTGNIILPNAPIKRGAKTTVKIIDWEMAQLGIRPLDLGQNIAELWLLKLYRDIDAGPWIIRGFVAGYGRVAPDFAFRTILHVGAHLISFGASTPGWGTSEQCEQVMKVGKDVLLHAWNKNRAAFNGHVLECLFF
ncbi:hypothetical protein S40285_00386 [Stachybotrys chlorohalonatus IBT 40285]|uniref:Aminoglycoside phosphotransferase domain-containing protein n=1 Tax=Stachybotrys chlorohalonatus (strain IBT 40285) TaxID=1283841 RepID=A0A084QHN4_STAC4|nr:hypothetical protein S40285_00386 [Stachybotrys chlorohalonata IBT 40285]